MPPFALFSYLILSTTTGYPIDDISAQGTTNGIAKDTRNVSDEGIKLDTIVDSIDRTYGDVRYDPIGHTMNETFLGLGYDPAVEPGNEPITDVVTERDVDEINEADDEAAQNDRLVTQFDFLFILSMVFIPFFVVECLNSSKSPPLGDLPLPASTLPTSPGSTPKALDGQPPAYESPPSYIECSIDIPVEEDQKLTTLSSQGGKAHWQTLKHVLRWMYLVRTSSAEKKKLVFVTV